MNAQPAKDSSGSISGGPVSAPGGRTVLMHGSQERNIKTNPPTIPAMVTIGRRIHQAWSFLLNLIGRPTKREMAIASRVRTDVLTGRKAPRSPSKKSNSIIVPKLPTNVRISWNGRIEPASFLSCAKFIMDRIVANGSPIKCRSGNRRKISTLPTP